VKWLPALLLLGVIACSSETTSAPPPPANASAAVSPTASAPPSSPTPTVQSGMPDVAQPSPSAPDQLPPAAPTHAVLVDLFAGGNSYDVAVVGADARVAPEHMRRRGLSSLTPLSFPT
jgi:hypothetical protein